MAGVEPSGSVTESQLICFLVMSVTFLKQIDCVLRHIVNVIHLSCESERNFITSLHLYAVFTKYYRVFLD
jgi:hypothetical protein